MVAGSCQHSPAWPHPHPDDQRPYMPTLLLLIASIALATPVLAQAQEKSGANLFQDGQNFLMDSRRWPAVNYGDSQRWPENYAYLMDDMEGRWFLDDKKGQPIPCKRTGIRADSRNVLSALIMTMRNLFKCGNVNIEQDGLTWKLTDKDGAKFVLGAEDEINAAPGMRGMAVRIRLDGGWGDSLYLVGVPKPAKAIPAPVIR